MRWIWITFLMLSFIFIQTLNLVWTGLKTLLLQSETLWILSETLRILSVSLWIMVQVHCFLSVREFSSADLEDSCSLCSSVHPEQRQLRDFPINRPERQRISAAPSSVTKADGTLTRQSSSDAPMLIIGQTNQIRLW